MNKYLVVNEILGKVVEIKAENVAEACQTLFNKVLNDLTVEAIAMMMFNETLVINMEDNADGQIIGALRGNEGIDYFIRYIGSTGRIEELARSMSKVFAH